MLLFYLCLPLPTPTVMSVSYSVVVTCREMANDSLVYDVFCALSPSHTVSLVNCANMIVSIPYICLLPNFLAKTNV